MIYDLIDATPKINKKKVIVTVIVALLVVAICIFLGIYFAKLHRNNKDNNVIENNVSVSETNTKSKHVAKVNFNPVYTEVGKDLMSKIYHSNEKVVYLTFDDGPSKTVTPLLLDLLKQEDIKATFFVLGARAKSNPDLIKREYNEGHFIANHGYSHVYGSIYGSTRFCT